jgi:predicted alpha/beta hydrolase
MALVIAMACAIAVMVIGAGSLPTHCYDDCTRWFRQPLLHSSTKYPHTHRFRNAV